MSRSKLLICLLVLGSCIKGYSQELFVYNEPASNMPARSVGIRLSNWIMDEENTTRTNYHLIPEVMVGINKNLMMHAEAYISNRTEQLSFEGVGLYAKYRFYSTDKVYRHFRMAAFGRATTNNADIHQQEIETNGHNTGYQLGLIGTQLLHKTALSVNVYYEKAVNNMGGNEFPATQSSQAVNYHFSAGHLLLPRRYTGYKQVNLNLMADLLGQSLINSSGRFFDIAPSVQLIFNSQTRVDIAYKFELYSNINRTAPNGLLIRIEHLLFNVR